MSMIPTILYLPIILGNLIAHDLPIHAHLQILGSLNSILRTFLSQLVSRSSSTSQDSVCSDFIAYCFMPKQIDVGHPHTVLIFRIEVSTTVSDAHVPPPL